MISLLLARCWSRLTPILQVGIPVVSIVGLIILLAATVTVCWSLAWGLEQGGLTDWEMTL